MKLKSLVAIAAIVVLTVILFLAFNLVQASPCDSIFEQAAAKLDTKLKFIASEGQMSIGKEKIQDLTEAAQLTALNLKTCCIVLDAGKLDSEQFLSCKSSVEQYDARLDEVVERVEAISVARDQGDSAAMEKEIRQFDMAVEQANSVSRSFENRLQSLQTGAAASSDSGASVEQEPNNDLFSPNRLPVDSWVAASISETSDSDYYRIVTGPTYRDIISVELQNRTTTMKPRIGVYHENKKWLGGTSEYAHDVTAGQDQAYSFSAPPGTTYHLRVTNLGKGLGDYRLRARPMRAYDGYEPNDDILSAATIQWDDVVEGNFMDRADGDFYRLEAGSREGSATISFDNLSTKVKPRIGAFDGDKKWIGGTSEYAHEVTAGQNQAYTFPVQANVTYFVRITNLSGVPGAYRLSVALD